MENPVKADDSDEKWRGYHGHTRAKHNLLQYYLGPWMKILGSSCSKIRVFDCFAGRGTYLGDRTAEPIELKQIETPPRVPGSPQIILDRAVEFSDLVQEIECIFIEKTEENAEMLENNLPAKSELPNGVTYKVVQGRFQEETRKQVRKTGGWNVPTFFFIDPFGYSQIEYDLITDLSNSQGFEVLINLMASEVVRWQDVDKHQDALKRPFGTDRWREELEEYQPQELDDKQVAYYCERLEENGPDHTLAYLVTEEDSKSMVYYLVFGTNSSKGLEIMRDGMQNCGPGEFAYAPHRDQISKDQSGLSEFTGNPMRDKLENLFSGCDITFDEIVSEYVEEESYTTFRRKHIRSELKYMENEEIVEVSRETSKTERGLGGEDVIHFPVF